jgi:hypothetical protein
MRRIPQLDEVICEVEKRIDQRLGWKPRSSSSLQFIKKKQRAEEAREIHEKDLKLQKDLRILKTEKQRLGSMVIESFNQSSVRIWQENSYSRVRPWMEVKQATQNILKKLDDQISGAQTSFDERTLPS